MEGDYSYKYELIKSYVSALIFSALKLSVSPAKPESTNAATRITDVFMEVLDRQFSIESISQKITCRSPADFADQLAIHINYLNRVLKKTTGKTTTELINERLLSEAKALLKHSNWNIAEISEALGYRDQSHFSSFFKSQTQYAPSDFRKV